MKDSFVLYNSFYEPLKSLSNEQLGRLFKAIFNYTINGEVTQENDIIIAFMFIKDQLDRDSSKWQEIRKKRSEAGKRHKGNQYSKMEQMEQVFQNGTNGTVDVDVDVDVDVIKKKKNNKKKNFKVPTLEEVEEYCKERSNGINAQSFIDFYDSKGWMIGKNKMKDWKAAIRTWERKRSNSNISETDTPKWFGQDLGRGGFDDDGEDF